MPTTPLSMTEQYTTAGPAPRGQGLAKRAALH